MADTIKLRIAEKYGLFIAIGLVAFFLIMRLFGLLYIVELRAFNLAIVVLGILGAMKTMQKTLPERFTYFQGIGTGILTGIIGSVVFSLFLFFYVSFFDSGLMQSIIENEPMGRFMNPYIVSVIISVEGIASSMLVAFIIINYLDPQKLE